MTTVIDRDTESEPLTESPAADAHRVAAAHFDGVVCFGGEDWWYHNRGHFDMQIMRELSARVPVLYINSIGMRVPRLGEGAMFFRRIARKLRSLRRGFVRVRPNFAVFSPVAAPGRLGSALSRALLPAQIRRAARRMGIHHPLVWVACPPGAPHIDRLGAVGVVYQRTDRYESFAGVDPDQIRGYDRILKDRAACTVYCSRSLMNEERTESRDVLFIDHGVDFEMFSEAGSSPTDPDDVRGIKRPRIGFIGGIDAHTFDPPLFVEVARTLPDCSFILVGACSLPAGWCGLPNVAMLGQKPYNEVARYMAACDVLIMPWNNSPWIKACNPVKLKEYLAVGRPVVSTAFDELGHYRGFVRVADNAADFAGEIRAALKEPGSADERRDRVRKETWHAKGDQVIARLRAAGLAPATESCPG